MDKENKTLDIRVAELTGSERKLSGELNNSRGNISQLEKRVKDLENTTERLTKDLETKSADFNQLSNQLHSTEAELKNKEKDFNERLIKKEISKRVWIVSLLVIIFLMFIFLVRACGAGSGNKKTTGKEETDSAETGPNHVLRQCLDAAEKKVSFETEDALRGALLKSSPGPAYELALLKGHTETLRHASFSTDGERVLTVSFDGSAKLWQIRTGALIADLRVQTGEITYAAMSPVDNIIITTASDGQIQFWNGTSGTQIAAVIGHNGKANYVEFSPQGDRAVTTGADGTCHIWDTSNHSSIAILRGHKGMVRQAVFSDDGKWIASAGEDESAKVWNTGNFDCTANLQGFGDPTFKVYFRDQNENLVLEGSYANYWLVRIADGKIIAYEPAPSYPDEFSLFSLSRDARYILVGFNDENSFWINEMFTGKKAIKIEGHSCLVRAANFNSDSSRIVTASCDGTARVWDTETRKRLSILRGHDKTLDFAGFSPDGRIIITADRNGTARLYYTQLKDLLALARLRLEKNSPIP
jgi:WD40 repeat protein